MNSFVQFDAALQLCNWALQLWLCMFWTEKVDVARQTPRAVHVSPAARARRWWREVRTFGSSRAIGGHPAVSCSHWGG